MRLVCLPGMVLVAVLSVPVVSCAPADSSEHGFVIRGEEALAQHHPGRAILDLERARLLSPGSKLIADDLVRARLSANLPTIEPDTTGTAAQLRRADHWGDVALAGLGLSAVAVLAVVGKRGGRASLVMGFLGGLIAAIGFSRSIDAEPPPNLGVVVRSGVIARIAPSVDAGVSFIPREGSLVSVLRTDHKFSLITDGGHRGWIPVSGVETILRKS